MPCVTVCPVDGVRLVSTALWTLVGRVYSLYTGGDRSRIQQVIIGLVLYMCTGHHAQ